MAERKDVNFLTVPVGGAVGGDAEVDDKGGGEHPFPAPSPVHEYDIQQSSLAVLKAELKLAAHDRESLKKELKRVSTERDGAFKQLALASGATSLDSGNGSGTLTRSFTGSSSDRSLSSNSGKDYDGLKQQCEKAMHELQLLRRQHSETIRRCDHTMKELDYCRSEHRTALSQLENTAQESLAMRSKFAELMAEKQRAEREAQNLQKFLEEHRKEILELRRQQQEVINTETGANDTVNQHYVAALRKYEVIKDDYDSLRKRYDDLLVSHSTAVNKLELSQEEVNRSKKNCEEIAQERNAAIRERNGLKQQCTAAIRQWDIALRERNEYREALSKVQQQHEEAVKEINQAMAVRMKASKDLKRLTEERNAAMQEYSLIMSERDTVHKEIEKLTDDLGQAAKKIKALEGENKDFSEEKKTLSYQIETLKREIASALHDRDKALKECNDLREKFGEYTAKEESNRESLKSRLEYDIYSRERDSSRKEQNEGTASSRDMYSKAQRERMDNLDQANQEIDRLRKQVDKLQAELQEAIQEAEVSKRRRDWAFSERDKIVLERESIRTLCDRLRKERDRAVSDLAEALRDSDDIKKQRNEASKELKELKEKMEAQLEKEARMKQLHAVGHNHSRDSAIDADMQEWETETFDIDVSRLGPNDDLGFDLVGGRDDPHYPNDSGIYVSSIAKGSVAEGKLKVHDCLVRVNNLECAGATKRLVLDAVRSAGSMAHVVVRRRRVGGRCLYTTQLQLTTSREHGLTLETGIYISKINPGSLAAKEGNLAVGDRVLSINSNTMDGLKNACEAANMLNEPADVLTITTLKGINSPSAPLSSSSSGHNITSEEGPNGFSSSPPTKERAQPKMTAHKMVNSCSQTEEDRHFVRNQAVSTDDTSDRKYMFGEKAAYNKVSSSKSSGEKGSNSSVGAWELIRGKIDSVTGRRNSKERTHDEKKRLSQLAQPTFQREQDDAIAELDNVIESCGRKQNGTNLKRSKRREKEIEKNGGTWPKCRSGPVIEHGTGTILHPRKHKGRLPLSALLSNPPKYPPEGFHNRQDKENQNHQKHQSSSMRDHEVPCSAFKSIDGSMVQFSKSGQLLAAQKSFLPTPQPRDLTIDRKSSSEIERDRLSALTPSDTSIDFSVKSGNIEKEVLEYYVKKKSSKHSQSDSESNMSPVETLIPSIPPYGVTNKSGPVDRVPSHSRIHSHGSPTSMHPSLIRPPLSLPHYQFTPFSMAPMSHPHPHPHSAGSSIVHNQRYWSPTHLPSSQSGESMMSSTAVDSRQYCFEPPYSPAPQAYSHSHSPSMEYMKPRSHLSAHSHPGYRGNDEIIISGYHGYEGGMHDIPSPPQFATADAQRQIRQYGGGKMLRENTRKIPSNQSVTSKSSAGKLSTGSIEHSITSERGSPMPNIHVEVLNAGRRGPGDSSTSGSLHEYNWIKKPQPGELRKVHIDKSMEPLGIQISCLESGGVFVSRVTEHSLASQVGLQVGDQLLEVCGINMRSATYNLAANVLRQCGNSITMLAQYCPDKYQELEGLGSTSSDDDEAHSRSGSPTPCNSPKPVHKPSPTQELQRGSNVGVVLSSSTHGTLTRHQISQAVSTLTRQNSAMSAINNSSESHHKSHEPRFVLLETKKSSNLGISLVGGNAVGIFVHSVQPDSPADLAGLRMGDQILEYNGSDLRHATAEEAAYELAKPADKVTMLAQYSLDRYNEVKDKPGDSFYIRAMFDRMGEQGELQLSFRKEDVLYVDNTMFNGVPGHWRAWLVDEDGQRQQCGIIPSKYKVEEELLLRRSLGDLEGGDARRGSTTARRSFFRRKKHQRSSSRDSKELASFSNISVGWYSDSGTLNEEMALNSYQRVERLDYPVYRPVMIMGPLADCVMDKLTQDYPDKFTRCNSELMHCSQTMIEKGIDEKIFIDYRRKGSHFECTTVASVKEICDKNSHCVLDVGLGAIQRLHRHQIYPIVLLVKFKSAKQVREVKDSRLLIEKVSAKAAKEMYDHALKLEAEYRHLISAVIPGGVNIAYMCTQAKAAVDQEQTKTLWVPRGSI